MRLSIVICSLLLVACFIGEECSDSPVFSDFKAEELKDKIGILIELEGSQIEKCESIWVKISDKPSATNSETKTVVYLLDKIATVWDDDNESVTAGIPEDEQVVQKGNKLQIQILVGLNAETAIPAQLEDGTNLPTADIEIKSGKINWKLIIFIGGCIIGFIIILVLIVNFCICCCRCCYCKPKDKKEKSSKKQKQEMYQQSPYLQRVQSSQQFRQPQLQPQHYNECNTCKD
ncbi:MAG: hypothetical protein EZS28_025748 [Streblomastix strix]|uniref:Uncharacterized protein n=1 Tax=Streblomastix strix TaxID=222440 RepID=A0A5J4V8C2_9EUKA|nr:MAG: hypothetical protein EZS28_025748 [Streblomastix strix]